MKKYYMESRGKGIEKGRKDEEEYVSSYSMTFRKQKKIL
jgi:hypothetical protein